MKHTKTPWNADPIDATIMSEDGYYVATTAPNGRCYKTGERTKEDKANAAHIVNCVNMHEELVEALEGLLNELQPRFMRTGCNAMEQKALRDVRRVLAKAKGE
jgi:hypothetical protein